MPPRKQKRRTKPAADLGKDSPAPQAPVDEIDHKPSGKISNSGRCKLAEFPTELLREVMSYIPAVAIPTGSHLINPALPYVASERWNTLRALSQTCRLWRPVFFPMLWERMEVCVVRQDTPPGCRMGPNGMEPGICASPSIHRMAKIILKICQSGNIVTCPKTGTRTFLGVWNG